MRRAWLYTVVLPLALSSVVGASTFLAQTPGEMVAGSTDVVRGKVVDSISFWGESGKMIYTEHQVQVDETWVGDAAGIVTVRTPGGKVGDYTVEAHGFPRLEEGENVVLFLSPGERGTMRIHGYQQGHFRVVTRRDGVTLAVPQVEEGARFFAPDGRLAPQAQSEVYDRFKAGVLARAAALGRDAGR